MPSRRGEKHLSIRAAAYALQQLEAVGGGGRRSSRLHVTAAAREVQGQMTGAGLHALRVSGGGDFLQRGAAAALGREGRRRRWAERGGGCMRGVLAANDLGEQN